METPNYPSTYSDYTQCVWIITVDPDMQVKLELPFVDVQCGEDFLEIRDGGDQFASRIDKLCGAVNPPVMVTRGNEMFLFFHSDGSGTATGFSGTWTAIPGCNQELNGTGGIIQSQNYPHNYYHRARCQWVIKTDPGTQIQLEFTSFSLQPSYLCRSDAVSIFDGEDRSALKLAKLCDNGEAPNIFISSGNAMTVRFRSDSSITAQGFQAQWGISQECSGNLTGNEGYIQSPNYPGLYPHMVTCEWVVRSDPGTKILLSLINNYLPVYSDCSLTDSITIRDGDSATSDLLAEICSSGDTDPIRSTSNVMYVKFRSNAELATKGFRAFYSTREPCNFVLTGDSGTIQSPEYPNNYPVHAHCTWLITSSPGTNLVLTFTDFDVEDTEHCRSDKLQTYDGNSIHSMSLGESCGNTLPKPVIAFSNSLFLYFTSDETGAGSGFQAEWTIFEGCGGNLDGNSGSFSSPNYPGNYHRGAWCEWVIRSDPGTQITLVFSDLEVQGDFYCNIDTVTIRDGGNVTGDLLGRFCSTSHLVPFASSGNEMYVAFRSSVSSFAGRGFQAHWSAAPACTYDVTGNTGTIQSSNYPNNYTDNANCMWKINTAPGTHIVLDFLTFDLQASQSCTDDSLAIYDGEDQYKTRLELLCGSNLPGSIISAGNHLFLHFRTDELETAYGFQIEWSIFQGCSANLTGNTGTIQSPNYPNNYPGNVLCDWTIRSDPGTNITLSFNDFDIVKTSSCSDDVVLVYDGEDDSAQPLSRMCGLGDPIPVTSTSNVMHVQFKSSSLYHDKGFQAQWSTNEGCLYELTGNSGTIQSPNYPDNYPNNILCSWVITTEVNSQAVLSFTDFDLQSSVDCSADAVSVYQLTDRRDALPILRKSHCGSTIPASVVRAASNILYITFMSDGSGTSRGFQADWSTYTGCGEELSGDNGTIKSPNFPNDYENYENCRWTITVDQGKRIKLEFISFDVENSADCVFDALRIVDTTLTELCGLRLPDPYTSSGNTLVLTFKTDGSGADSGFDIRWSVTDGY